MPTQRIAFRTDANSQIGTGHFMRCLTLADELKQRGSEICFISRALPKHFKKMLHDKKIELCELSDEPCAAVRDDLPHSHWLRTSQYKDASESINFLSSSVVDWLIVDHYAIDHRWEKKLRSVVKNILVIDDLADRNHECDILLDQNFYLNLDQRYNDKVPINCLKLLGPAYSLVRSEFRENRKFFKSKTEAIKNVLVFFGGIDANNYTTQVVKAFIELNWDIHLNIVVGHDHAHIEEIQKLCTEFGFSLHIQTTNMAQLMLEADLAIGAGGSSVWERFCMGLPTLCICAANNQKQQIADLQEAGLVIAPEKNQDIRKSIYQTMLAQKSDPSSRKFISEKVFDLVDGYGAIKVSNILFSADMKIRLANESDSRSLHAWRNHPVIRSASVSQKEIDWAEHQKWFSEKCGQIDYPILIGEVQQTPVGVVRFDIHDGTAEVSIYLVPEPSYRGLGRKLLSAAENWLVINRPKVSKLIAYVLQGNGASIRLFQSMGYVKKNDATQIEFEKKL
jgi:UDP-2,4-diacetamido-2,4,6-trideoxy-beta-L-altropyranose hydrolase